MHAMQLGSELEWALFTNVQVIEPLVCVMWLDVPDMAWIFTPICHTVTSPCQLDDNIT